jgi:hypothetical protein
VSDLRDLVQDLRAHAHEAPAHCAALMRRAARELRLVEPDCGLCRDTGELIVGEKADGVIVTTCTCRKEKVDAQS